MGVVGEKKLTTFWTDLKTVSEVEDSELSPEAFTTNGTLLRLPVIENQESETYRRYKHL